MVSTGQMMGYVMAILLPLIAVLIPFYILWKQSSKVERGMLGAIGYGIMGYFWQEIIYSFLGLLALTKMRDVFTAHQRFWHWAEGRAVHPVYAVCAANGDCHCFRR